MESLVEGPSDNLLEGMNIGGPSENLEGRSENLEEEGGFSLEERC